MVVTQLLALVLVIWATAADASAHFANLRTVEVNLGDLYGLNGHIILGNFSAIDHIRPRQQQCEDPGYVPCSNVADKCCPTGDACFADWGCCPEGQQPCGNDHCYNPSTDICCQVAGKEYVCQAGSDCCGAHYCYKTDSQVCCDGGVCEGEQNKLCCANQCCDPDVYASCDANGGCARATCTTTSTTTFLQDVLSTTERTTRKVITVYDAEKGEGSQLPGFKCPPATYNNTDTSGTSLELGDNCKLTLHIDLGATSTPAVERRAGSATATNDLRRRADLVCTATVKATSTLLVTSTVTTTSTTTLAPTSLNFNCIPIVVTATDGDELALGDDCSLEYTPADSTSSDELEGPSTTTSDDYNPNFPATITVEAAPVPEATTTSSSAAWKTFPFPENVVSFAVMMILAVILI